MVCRVGTHVRDKYRIDALLSKGAASAVYAATHRNGGRFALRILHPEMSADEEAVSRFKRNAGLVHDVGHPALVRTLDDDVTEDGCPFVVLELAEGETAEEKRVRSGGTLDVTEVLNLADIVLDALSALHSRELVHGNVSAESVVLSPNGGVKLLGLRGPAGERGAITVSEELWDVGAMLFSLLTGETVARGSRSKTVGEVAPRIPSGVASVVDRALLEDRAIRWDDAAAMQQALRWTRRALEIPDPPAVATPSEKPPLDTPRAFRGAPPSQAVSAPQRRTVPFGGSDAAVRERYQRTLLMAAPAVPRPSGAPPRRGADEADAESYALPLAESWRFVVPILAVLLAGVVGWKLHGRREAMYPTATSDAPSAYGGPATSHAPTAYGGPATSHAAAQQARDQVPPPSDARAASATSATTLVHDAPELRSQAGQGAPAPVPTQTAMVSAKVSPPPTPLPWQRDAALAGGAAISQPPSPKRVPQSPSPDFGY